ncbi:uncharacterized protein LOC112093377 [Morus notabilis]|uniref:uncharacterized protein LOC112093377 n=1 Tax=Morus notabilis TaxID=981085 RepID=UPI000CECF826|nr:uncharacterized protein LOC112093377 [Morus notabilis]
MHGKHGVEISYYKARMARRYALASMRRSAVESYSSIHFLCNVFKEKNPGSVTSYELDNDGRFKLKEAIETREELVILSNRKSSIPKAVEKAYRKEDFGYFMRQLEAVRPAIQNYLLQVGVEKWARAHFERKRYDVMTTNISESLNNVLVNAREYPIEVLIEHFRSLLQIWFYERRNKADQTFTYLTKHATKCLRDRKKIACCLSVQPIYINKYYVVDGLVGEVVDLVARTCSCLVWQADEFPCPHAIASIWKRNLDPAHFTSYYYTNNAFKATYDAGSEVEVVLPPEFKRGVERPRKQRIISSGEREKQSMKCSRCKKVVHNRRTCSNPTFVDMN